MKLIQLLITGVLLTGQMAANAEETIDEPGQDQYQAAIASFGIEESASEIASREALKMVREKRLGKESDPLAHLPPDWLEGSPY